MEFTYPVVFNLPRTNPQLGKQFYNFSSDNLEEWRGPRNTALAHIREHIIRQDSVKTYLPAGTKLYHGSLDQHLTLSKDRITFFGLDVVISLWYILEMNQGRRKIKRQLQGTLYEFVTTRDIPVKVLTTITDEAAKTPECKMIGCIHPQVAYHDITTLVSDPEPPFDLSIEVTLPMKHYRDALRLVRTYGVDIQKLIDNSHKTFREFNPTDAINEIEMVPLRGGMQRTRRRKIKRRLSR
jgi:hypothetical protein